MSDALCVMAHPDPAAASVGLLCEHHAQRITWQLADILDWWALLPALLIPTSDGEGNHRGKRIDSPSPIRLDVVAVDDLRTGMAVAPGDIVGVRFVLYSWARVVLEELANLGRAPGTRENGPQSHATHWGGTGSQPHQLGTLTGIVGILERYGDWIAAQPWVDDYASELAAAHRQLRHVAGVRPPTVIAHCPVVGEQGECGGALHQDRWGGMGVTCDRCGARWGDVELRRLGLVIG